MDTGPGTGHCSLGVPLAPPRPGGTGMWSTNEHGEPHSSLHSHCPWPWTSPGSIQHPQPLSGGSSGMSPWAGAPPDPPAPAQGQEGTATALTLPGSQTPRDHPRNLPAPPWTPNQLLWRGTPNAKARDPPAVSVPWDLHFSPPVPVQTPPPRGGISTFVPPGEWGDGIGMDSKELQLGK